MLSQRMWERIMIGHKDEFIDLEQYICRASAEWYIQKSWHKTESDFAHEMRDEISDVRSKLLLGTIDFLRANKKPLNWAPEFLKVYLQVVEQQMISVIEENNMEVNHVLH